ncbi:hypothetical protein NQT62_11125 [Limnobacter humi]|uniref:Uncharacterized protein n=1 Tax=Limnobacter humi TaxID=1778671 RepID=A0ABT1WHU6_9BURK|nr:hypothetical protein [Limnobacter humi]MCQ8896984.1 hypothetical protein [Limnobacter humi]
MNINPNNPANLFNNLNPGNHADAPWLNLPPILAPMPHLAGNPVAVQPPPAPLAQAAQDLADALPVPNGSPHTPPDQILPPVLPLDQLFWDNLHAHVMGAAPVAPPAPQRLGPGVHQFGGQPQRPVARVLLPAFNALTPGSAASTQTREYGSPPSVCKPGVQPRPRDGGSDDDHSPNPRAQQRLRA